MRQSGEGLAALRQELLRAVAPWVVAACAAAPALAQRNEGAPVALPGLSVEGAAPAPPYKPEQVSSRKFTQPLVDTPKTVTVIPKKVIQERGATSVTEILRQVPGISLGAGEGGIAAGDRTFIRGYEARGDNFTDGFRDFGTYFRDPFNIEQVEVLKGPGSAYTGRGSTGGSINYVTKVPQAETFYGGTAALGTDATKRLTGDANLVLAPGMALRLNAVGHDAEIAGRDDAVYNRRYGFAPSFSLGLDTPTRATISYLYLEQDNMPDYGHPFDLRTGKPVEVDRENFYGLAARDYDKANVHVGSLRLEHDVSEALKLRSQFRYGQTERNFVVTKPAPIPAAGAATVVRDSRSRDSVDRSYGNQTDATVKFGTLGIDHTLVAGVELVEETQTNQPRTISAATPASLASPDPGESYTGQIAYSRAVNEANVRTAAAFVFDTLKLTPRWELVGGIRYDRIRSEVDSTAATGVLSEFSRTDDLVSGQGAVVYKPVENASVYVAYGTSFNPSAEFLALAANSANVDPEENRSYEIGAKWDALDRKLALTLALFRTEKTNARQTDPLGGPDLLLVGEQRVDGIEAGFAGALTRAWSVYGGYTYLDSEIVSSVTPGEVGSKLPNVPTHAFAVFTTYEVLRDVSIGFGATYNSPRYANNVNTLKLPPYWRFDATASYRVNDNVAVRLNILNITDELYYDATHNGQHAFVAPGRSALVTTSFSF